ncbi:SGNH/GDSL hydrolase family protein [Streptomyces sp. NPDC051561]|uniref:SGNH/GDSL hydrolase family protein n=1 Tax=Streptomyces sp. NPDC051561 TaxID=3365658 RepID=UPI0037A38A27
MLTGTRKTVLASAVALALSAGTTAVTVNHSTPRTPAATTSTASSATAWTAGWAASPQRASVSFKPNWSEAGFDNHTVRQVVRVSADGTQARIRLSNAYGTSPLLIERATVARTAKGASVRPGSVRELTFSGSRSASVPAGGQLSSDRAALGLRANDQVTVTLHLKATTGPATFHAQSFTDSYRAKGDHTTDTAASAFTEKTESWYYLSGVDVTGSKPPAPHSSESGAGHSHDHPRDRSGIVLFGDSITDGFASTPNADRRYSDALAARLKSLGKQRPVLNSGIGGNLILNDSAWYGERATTRFSRDALDLPGVGTVVVLGGLNDIGYRETTTQPTYHPAADITGRQLINGHQELIRQAHAKGLRVVGATLLPLGGSDHYGKHSAAASDEFNNWVRTSGAFDAYVDFDKALADPADPEHIRPSFDSGDHLHPNDAGYRAMAAALNPNAL